MDNYNLAENWTPEYGDAAAFRGLAAFLRSPEGRTASPDDLQALLADQQRLPDDGIWGDPESWLMQLVLIRTLQEPDRTPTHVKRIDQATDWGRLFDAYEGLRPAPYLRSERRRDFIDGTRRQLAAIQPSTPDELAQHDALTAWADDLEQLGAQ